MNDQVLTDEEKDALIDGMSNGEVEVQSSGGPQYAEVREFEIGPRARIVSHSYPRLELVNQQLASRLGKQVEQMLGVEINVVSAGLRSCTFTDFCDDNDGLALLVEFSSDPLPGTGLVYLNAALVGNVVETFFGGSSESGHTSESFFTSGEINVAKLFADALLTTLVESWKPFIEVEAEKTATHQGTDVVDSVEASDSIVACEFSIDIAGAEQPFFLILPVLTIAPLVPVFEGQKRERDQVEDARWERALRAKITDSIINISSTIGRRRMTLGQVADLEPGAIFEIDSPQRSTVYASNVAILEGRFGVHDGRYAIEANKWLEPQSDATPA